jgi:peptidyl-prolyl cis-trans isomerase D
MIAFFRSILSSKLVLALFALIMLAFVITGVGTGSGGLENLAGGANRIAQVGGLSIDTPEAARSIQTQLDAARQQQPGLDIAGFVKNGGADQVIDQMINSRVFEAFGKKYGMVASQRMVDAELIGIQAFRGPTGQFDRNVMLSLLDQRGLTEPGLRDDIARSKIASMMLVPAGGAARVPAGVVAPFAALLLESREGQIASVPNAAFMSGPEPTDAELAQFYTRNAARYTAPETRTIRYALIDKARFAAQAKPTDGQIAAAYKAKTKDYAGRETRVFTQVIVADQKKADAIVASVKAGTPIATAAKSAGGEATTLAAQDEAGYAGLSSAAASKAAFAAKAGDTLTAGKSALGWHVVHVDKVTPIAGKSLDAARAELAPEIEKANYQRLFAEFVTEIDNAVSGDGATFDDVVKKFGLTATTTPALTAGGIAPADPGYKAPPEFTPLIKDVFQAELEDNPTALNLNSGQLEVFYDLESITPATPRPLAAIRDEVIADFKADRAARASKKLADAIAAKVSTGTPIAQAVSNAGIALPGLRPMRARRLDIAQAQGNAPGPLVLLFGMSGGTAKVLESEDKKGWYVVSLSRIIPGDLSTQPQLVEISRQQLGQVVGEEYVAQFVAAMKADLKVSRNEAAITRLKRSLSGATSSQ